MQSGEGREWLPFFMAAMTRESALCIERAAHGSALNMLGARVCAFSAQFLAPNP